MFRHDNVSFFSLVNSRLARKHSLFPRFVLLLGLRRQRLSISQGFSYNVQQRFERVWGTIYD